MTSKCLSVIPGVSFSSFLQETGRAGHDLSYTQAQPSRSHKDNGQLFKASQIPDNSSEDFPSTYRERGLGKRPLIQRRGSLVQGLDSVRIECRALGDEKALRSDTSAGDASRRRREQLQGEIVNRVWGVRPWEANCAKKNAGFQWLLGSFPKFTFGLE